MGLEKMLKDKKDKADIDAYLAPFKEQLLGDFDKYFPETDKKIFAASLKYYVKALPADRQNSVFTTFIMKRYKAKTVEAAIDRFLDAAYTKSIFTDKARMQAFMEKPTAKVLASDPMYGYVKAVFADVMRVQSAYLSAMRAITPCERVFIEGLREFQPNRVFYADANSTLRLTYGTVKAYKPCDAVSYNYVTYADGILEKENPADDEFIVPKELKDKILKKEYAGFADKTGKMPVCFLTDNDITGGNSGSPVINGKGELIGLAFDGNWEWLCSNLLFSNELERTINVDSRYVLWLIGDVYGAKNIIAELDVRH